MKIIELNSENIKDEHICCAFSDKKCSVGYQAKKDFITSQLRYGYKFKKFDIRGKVFIEYVPAEFAWAPIVAPQCNHINCFWVSGQYAGQGYGKALLGECINDSVGKYGITAIAGKKKMPFLNDPKFLTLQGFELCDEAPPYFGLYFKRLRDGGTMPKFADSCRSAQSDLDKGLVAYYSAACPFTDYYVNNELLRITKDREVALTIVPIDSLELAQKHFVPFTIFSIFYNGKFCTHHILTEKNFDKFVKLS